MEPYVRRFIRSSLIWLGTGVLLGVWMAVEPSAVVYRPAHMHANLLGFVSMMIFGVAYHVLPRFSGVALRSRRSAVVHLWLANSGLALMVSGWMLRGNGIDGARLVLASGGIASAVGAFLFIINIWLTTAPRAVTISRPAAVVRS